MRRFEERTWKKSSRGSGRKWMQLSCFLVAHFFSLQPQKCIWCLSLLVFFLTFFTINVWGYYSIDTSNISPMFQFISYIQLRFYPTSLSQIIHSLTNHSIDSIHNRITTVLNPAFFSTSSTPPLTHLLYP